MMLLVFKYYLAVFLSQQWLQNFQLAEVPQLTLVNRPWCVL